MTSSSVDDVVSVFYHSLLTIVSPTHTHTHAYSHSMSMWHKENSENSAWEESPPSTWLMHLDGLPVDLTYIDRAQWWHCLSKHAAQQGDMGLTLPEWQNQNNKAHCMKVIDVSARSLHESLFKNAVEVTKLSFVPPPFTKMKPYTVHYITDTHPLAQSSEEMNRKVSIVISTKSVVITSKPR